MLRYVVLSVKRKRVKNSVSKIFTKEDLHKSWGNAPYQCQLYRNCRPGLHFNDVRILEMERWTTELVQMVSYTAPV